MEPALARTLSQPARGRRRLVVCADDTPAAAEALSWALDTVYREGDVVHLA